MNYRLSIAALRVKGKRGFVIESKGKTLEAFVHKSSSLNLKEDILITLTDGLRAIKSYIKHEDILFIEIQNQHLQQWLSGMVEYKDYVEALDSVFEVLETLDCRYRFIFIKDPYAKKVVSQTNLSKEEGNGSSLLDVIKEFEEN